MVAAALALALPGAAGAATLCVNKLGPQCDQIFPANQLQAAISKANENQSSPDRIEIGAGTYDTGPYNASSAVDVIGAGRDETVLTNVNPTAFDGPVFLANFENQTISDLTVRIGPGEYARGLQVGAGAVVERVRIDRGPNSEPGLGLDAFGATLRQVVVQLPQDEFLTGAAAAGTIEDSTFEAGTGLFFGGGVARRVVAVGHQAVTTRTSRIEDSLLRAVGPNAVGLALGQFDGGEVVLSHLTIAGDSSPGSIGIKAEKGSGAFASLSSVLTVRNTAVSGFATALTHRGNVGTTPPACGTNCPIAQTTDVAYSALDFPERIANFGGPGSLTLGAGNVDLGDPRFVDPAAGDFRLRYDSPLIDAADPLPLGSGGLYAGESPVDFAGVERIVDGRAGGDPAARRDIGAYEYPRRPPSLTVAPPTRALLYRPVSISASASDPDPFDLLTLRYAFDGRDAGESSSHVFTKLGTHGATVTVTDPTGIAATAATSFAVRALPGKCANRRSGGRRRDRFTGTSAGETLNGAGGADLLRGLGGRDCLKGGAGDDVLNGGKGKDRLVGGKGDDRISDRDRRRDVVNCGPGDDTAIVDRKDALRHCETTRLR